MEEVEGWTAAHADAQKSWREKCLVGFGCSDVQVNV